MEPCWCNQPHEIDHGTLKGYRQHVRLRRDGHQGVAPCEPCKAVVRDRMREWRTRRPELSRRLVNAQHCRDKAMRRLAQLYPRKMRQLYQEELRNAGLEDA